MIEMKGKEQMDYQNITLEKKNSVATLTFNRPDKMNALSPYLLYEAAQALKEVRDDDDAKVLVITGAGRGFCSGADLTFPAEDAAKFRDTLMGRRLRTTPFGGFGEVSKAIRELPKPVIGAVNGAATGAGFALSLACDIRIASENARFSALFVRRGFVPDTGITYYLPRAVGTAKALELLWTGDMIDAKEAERIGIVSKVVSPEDLLPETYDLAERLARGASISIEIAKEAVYKAQHVDLAAAMAIEAWGQSIAHTSEDRAEGQRAFVEKREPKFKGR